MCPICVLCVGVHMCVRVSVSCICVVCGCARVCGGVCVCPICVLYVGVPMYVNMSVPRLHV